MKLFPFPPVLTLPTPRDPANMKRFLWLIPIVFFLISATASADSFRILFFPNDGGGDNFIVQKQVADAKILINGGTSPPFFTTFYEPGSTIGGTTQVFFGSSFVQVGGNSFELSFLDGPGSLFMSSFTLPTNGKDFTVPVMLRFSASGTVIDTGQTFDLGGSANGHITFHFSDGFYFTDRAGFIPAPEPGTVGLMATGLAGIVGVIRRKRSV